MIVTDASALIDLLLGNAGPAGEALAARFQAREVVCAPHLIDAEVGQVLRRFTLRGSMSSARLSAAIQDLIDLPIERFPQAALLPRAVQLMDNVTVYDALYLALAEALECSLLTSDEALAGVPGCTTTVVVLRSGG